MCAGWGRLTRSKDSAESIPNPVARQGKQVQGKHKLTVTGELRRPGVYPTTLAVAGFGFQSRYIRVSAAGVVPNVLSADQIQEVPSTGLLNGLGHRAGALDFDQLTVKKKGSRRDCVPGFLQR